MTPIIIDPSIAPVRFYAKTVSEPGEKDYRLRLLPGQYIPTGNDNEYLEASTSWNVSGNKQERNNYPEGTVFEMVKLIYRQSAKTEWVFSNDRNFLRPVDITEAEQYIEQIALNVKALTKTDLLDDPVTDDEEILPKTAPKTLVEELMLKHPCPTIGSHGFYIKRSIWKQLVRHVERRENIMLVGDSGVGKTEINELLAASFDLPVFFHDMGAMQDPVASLIGVHRIDSDGKSMFDYSRFVTDIQKPALNVMDEVNRMPINGNNILFSLTDSRRYLDTSLADSNHDRIVKVHDECRFIATANIGATFTGTNDLDEALFNRFIVMELDYPPNDIEIALMQKRTDVGKEEAEKVVRLADTVRSMYREQKITKNISIRLNLKMCSMIRDGFSIMEAWDAVLPPYYGREEFPQINDIIQSM